MFKTKTKIITFEGIDGSGKTTHIKKIEKYLKLKKIQFISFREPGGSKNAEKIRKLILNNNNNFDYYDISNMGYFSNSKRFFINHKFALFFS